jgi:hypothetical protein
MQSAKTACTATKPQSSWDRQRSSGSDVVAMGDAGVALSGEYGVDAVVQGLADVSVVRDGAHQRHAARLFGIDSADHERGRIDQQPGRDALGETMAL